MANMFTYVKFGRMSTNQQAALTIKEYH